MGLRADLMNEYENMGGDPRNTEGMDIEEIRDEIRTLKRKKKESFKQPDWKERLSEEDKEFVKKLEGWGYSEDTMKEIVQTNFDQGDYHEETNGIIKAKNEAKRRYGLEHLVEPLLPTKEDILDMYRHGILDDWLNHAPDPEKPHFKPNKRFQYFADEIVLGHEIKERQEQEAEELEASIKSKYNALTKDIPKRIVTDKETGEPLINPEFKQWLSDAKDFKKTLETKIKICESQRKEGFDVPYEKTVRVTRRNLLNLIEEKTEEG